MLGKREWLAYQAGFPPGDACSVCAARLWSLQCTEGTPALCPLMNCCACKPKAALDCTLHIFAERWQGCLSMLTVFPAANDDVVLFHTGLCWLATLDLRAVVTPQVAPHLELNSSVHASYSVRFQC